MFDFCPTQLVRGAFAGLLALALFPALANAEITAASDFPLATAEKAVKADAPAKLLEIYRQDVLSGQSGSKKEISSSPEASTSR